MSLQLPILNSAGLLLLFCHVNFLLANLLSFFLSSFLSFFLSFFFLTFVFLSYFLSFFSFRITISLLPGFSFISTLSLCLSAYFFFYGSFDIFFLTSYLFCECDIIKDVIAILSTLLCRKKSTSFKEGHRPVGVIRIPV